MAPRFWLLWDRGSLAGGPTAARAVSSEGCLERQGVTAPANSSAHSCAAADPSFATSSLCTATTAVMTDTTILSTDPSFQCSACIDSPTTPGCAESCTFYCSESKCAGVGQRWRQLPPGSRLCDPQLPWTAALPGTVPLSPPPPRLWVFGIIFGGVQLFMSQARLCTGSPPVGISRGF